MVLPSCTLPVVVSVSASDNVAVCVPTCQPARKPGESGGLGAVSNRINATNLLDTTYYQYDGTPNAPVGFYKNGRLFTLSMNFAL